MSALVEQMRFEEESFTRLDPRPALKYRTFAGFFLAEGEAMTNLMPFAEVSKTVGDYPVRQCYDNAVELVLDNPDQFRYCEGYAISASGIGFGVHHAWVMNEQGVVIDPTWTRDIKGNIFTSEQEEAREYYGVVVDADSLERWGDLTGYGQILATCNYDVLPVLLTHGMAVVRNPYEYKLVS